MKSRSSSFAIFDSCIPHLPSRSVSLRLLCLSVIATSLLPSCTMRPRQAYFDGSETKPGKENAWNVKRRFDSTDRRDLERSRFIVTEFGEDGKPWLKPQLDTALEQIKTFKPKTVLLYVHGWHNDSSPDCGEGEGKDLRDLDGLLHQMQHEKLGKVLAIYVAWRGESVNNALFKWFTLNGRRNVARKIGASPDLRAFLGDVAEAGKSARANVVFAGHSLGAALLEKSAALMIQGSTTADTPRLPDLFLLVNSAEISYVSQREMKRVNEAPIVTHEPEGLKLVSPRVLCVTSTKDGANRYLQPLNNYLVPPLINALKALPQELFLNAPGFDRSARTHLPQKTLDRSPVLDEAQLGKKQLELSLKPTLDPVFWVPDKEHRLTKYRIVPKASYPRTTGFWNIATPGALAPGHNAVYHDKFMAACVSWFRIARHNDANLPNTLPEILAKLKQELREHPPMSPEFADRGEARAQWLMGAAMRMPYNKATFGLLLGELESSNAEIIDELDTRRTGPLDYPAIVRSHRVHLFAILKYTHSAKDVWDKNPALLSRLKALMEQEDMQDALARTGAAKTGTDRETDENLKAFYKFLRKHDIRTP